jgi:hypothetical protein
LKADKRAFFTACSQAYKAADYLRGLALAAPMEADIASVPQITVKAELCTEERGAKLCDQLLASVIPRAEPVLQIPIKPGLVRRPVSQLMESHIVEMIRSLERVECGAWK